MTAKKIISLLDLSKKTKELKNQNKKIVHCHGVFDVLHIGHIKHFNTAKKRGDILILTVTPDSFVNKGPNRPIFTLDLRMQCLAALKSVDYIAANNSADAVSAIKLLKPNVYCKGKDYQDKKVDVTGKIRDEEAAVKKIGGKIFYTQDDLFSSSKIINNIGYNLTDKQKKYLDNIRLNKNLIKNKSISKIINSFNKLKVLVVGETIIDEYTYCEALGKSGKEPVLVLRELFTEKYLGGAASIAKNLSGFCKKVSLLSFLGEKREHEKFISKNLQKNIYTNFISKKNSCTIVKKRFVDNINKTKVLGLHSLNDQPLDLKQKRQFNKLLAKYINNHDVVIVSDYGHGLISKESVKLILKKSKFLAVNAQLNSANIGYHTISKYKGADLIIINENEMRHELRNKIDDVNVLIKELAIKLKSKFIAVTSGERGAKIYNNSLKKITDCPAFANKVTDKIGTGDTMLALLTICIFKKINISFSMLLASLAAAENIQHMANSITVTKSKMLKTLESYLK